MIKILHVLLGLQVGGLERFVLDLISETRGCVDSKVACLEEAGVLARELDGIKVIELKKSSGLRLGVVSEIAKIVVTEKIDLIHTHNPAPHFYGALAGRLSGIPVIHTKHGRNYPGNIKKVLLNKISSALSKKIIAVSDDAAQVCLNIEKISPNKLNIILNGINPNVYVPKPCREILPDLGVGKGRFVIGSVARLAPEKGHLTLLQACLVLRKMGVDFCLVLVGDGPERGALESFVIKHGLEGSTLFTGTRHDVPLLVPEFDVFVLSSKTEGVSLTLLEAMSCQVPVVATAVGGNPEVVEDGITGFIVPEGQPEAMAQKIHQLFCDVALREKMGISGRERVLYKFSLQGTSAAYLEIYRELLG